jgi:hypothetical protein
MVFFLEITNIWQKSQDFWFVDFYLEIFVAFFFIGWRLCAKEIHRLDPMDLKIYSQGKKPRL